jgi:hypothetical protein
MVAPRNNLFLSRLGDLATGIVSTWDRKYGVRYTMKELPAYLEVLEKVRKLVLEVVEEEPFAGIHSPQKFSSKVQAVLVLGLQCCIPPIRGRPFWDLKMRQERGTIMGILGPQ